MFNCLGNFTSLDIWRASLNVRSIFYGVSGFLRVRYFVAFDILFVSSYALGYFVCLFLHAWIRVWCHSVLSDMRLHEFMSFVI